MLQNRCWLISKVVLGLSLIIQTQAAIQDSVTSTGRSKSAELKRDNARKNDTARSERLQRHKESREALQAQRKRDGNAQPAIDQTTIDKVTINDDTSGELKAKMSQDSIDRIAKLQRDSSRSDRLALCSLLESVRDYLSIDGLDKQAKRTLGQEPEKIVEDIKQLCDKLGIDDGGMDWQELALCLSEGPLVRSCNAVCSNVVDILAKVTFLKMNMGPVCGIPIQTIDLPFTASIAGQTYVVTEPLTHTGGTSAITILATGVIIDMCGHRLATTTMTAPAIQLTGTYATIKNGFIETDGSSDAINIAVAATDAIIENMAFLVTTGNGHVISSLGPVRPYIHNVDINMPNVGTGSAIFFSDPGVTEKSSGVHIDGFSISTDRATEKVSPAIYIQTSFIDTSIKNGSIIWGGSSACEGAIVLDGVVNFGSGILVQDIYIREGGNSGLRIEFSNVNSMSGILVKGLVVESNNSFGFTGTNLGIVLGNSASSGTIEDCICFERLTSFSIQGTEFVLSNNLVKGGTTGYDILSFDNVLRNNSAFDCDTGFSCNSGYCILQNNGTIDCLIGFSTSNTSSYYTLEYNKVINSTTGFQILDTSQITLRDNKVVGTTTGFNITTAQDVILENNSANKGDTGFGLLGVTTAVVRNNIAIDFSTAGFSMDSTSARVTFEHNAANKCPLGFSLSGSDIIFDSNSANSTIGESSSTAFDFVDVTNVVVKNNIAKSYSAGFSITGISDNITIEDNTAVNCREVGYRCTGSINIILKRNSTNHTEQSNSGNLYGFDLTEVADGIVKDNEALHCQNPGLGMGIGFSVDVTSSNIVVESNTADACDIGFLNASATARYGNNVATYNTTNYSGAIFTAANTFSLATPLGFNYWYNATT